MNGVGGSHHSAEELLALPRSTGRILLGVAIALGVLTLIGLALSWPSRDAGEGLAGFTSTYYDARVDEVDVGPCPGAPTAEENEAQCAQIDVSLLEGPDEGRLVPLDVFDAGAADFELGERVVLE